MDIVTLTREKSGPDGTFGTLFIQGKPICRTLEDPWNNNQHRNSCISKGNYTCIPHGWDIDSSAKKRHVWEVTGVPGRTAVLIHAGNTINDTLGCILVGVSEGDIGGQHGIVDSQAALNLLRTKLPTTFTLSIQGVVG